MQNKTCIEKQCKYFISDKDKQHYESIIRIFKNNPDFSNIYCKLDIFPEFINDIATTIGKNKDISELYWNTIKQKK